MVPSESSSSSNQTFSSSETELADNEDQDSSYDGSGSSSSSLRESFEIPQDAPKCHRGHIHKRSSVDNNLDDNSRLMTRKETNFDPEEGTIDLEHEEL